MMVPTNAKHWLTRGSIGLIAILLLVGVTSSHATAPDIGCLQNASRDRSRAIHDAYDQYARDMGSAADRLGDRENNALGNTDFNARQNDLNRANSDFSYEANTLSNRLRDRISQIWYDYQTRFSVCGGQSAAPWLSNGPSTYNNNYAQPYRQNGCPQIVMTNLAPGCGYECNKDSGGMCTICSPVCGRVRDTRLCNCALNFDPVCGKDRRTYTNSCFASCADTDIDHAGLCN